MDKFQNKYRIPSARLHDWNYGSEAAYFITICTQDRHCFFGDLVNGNMTISEIGQIVSAEWLRTFDMRSDMHLQMGEFVVMPNHFHGIIIIGENEFNTGATRGDAMQSLSTNHLSSQFGRQSKNLASIVGGFKSAVTKKARSINPDFAWQSRFHDHVIRNAESYQTISEYIITNPLRWTDDALHPLHNIP